MYLPYLEKVTLCSEFQSCGLAFVRVSRVTVLLSFRSRYRSPHFISYKSHNPPLDRDRSFRSGGTRKMVKSQKSSASSATRKKHARKAQGPAGGAPDHPQPKEKKPKGKEKGKNKEPKKKVYIPPVKPAPIQPDPLDTLGLAHQLPAELLVVLKSLKKKDAVTKGKALEELQGSWVDRARREREDGDAMNVLGVMLPVWFHHLPPLLLHPSRKIRLLTAGLHSSLLRIPTIRSQMLTYILETASADQVESILGTWLMSMHDVDRLVSSYAKPSWDGFVSLVPSNDDSRLHLDPNASLPSLLSFLTRAALDPNGVYAALNPVAAPAPPPSSQRKGGKQTPSANKMVEEESSRAKADEEQENEQDRSARLRIGALGAVRWVLDPIAKVGGEQSISDLSDLLSNPALWTSLYNSKTPPFVDVQAFGWNQPGVRKAAWALLHSLTRIWKEDVKKSLLGVLSTAVLRSAWVETDALVRDTMWVPLLTFLREFPSAWEIDASAASPDDEDEEGSGSEEEAGEGQEAEGAPRSKAPRTSESYREFLRFLELGCSGSPLQGYPVVVIVLATVPSSILVSSSSQDFLTEFTTSFWAAVDGHALSGLDRQAASAAFLSALLECTVFLIKRLRNDASLLARLGEDVNADDVARRLTKEQYAIIREALKEKRLKVDTDGAARLMAGNLGTFEQMGGGLFEAGWDALTSSRPTESGTTDVPSFEEFPQTLKVFDECFEAGTAAKQATRSLIRQISAASLDQAAMALRNGDQDASILVEPLRSLVTVLEMFGSILFTDVELASRIDHDIRDNVDRLLSACPALVIAYLRSRGDESICLQTWQDILRLVAGKLGSVQTVLQRLLQAARTDELPPYLKPEDNGLDGAAGTLLARALDGSDWAIALIREILQASSYFISDDCLTGLVRSLVSAFTLQFENALRDSSIPISSFEAAMDIAGDVFARHAHLLAAGDISLSFMPSNFLFGYMLPKTAGSANNRSFTAARKIWTSWLASAPSALQLDVMAVLKHKIHDLILDPHIRPTATDIYKTLQDDNPGLTFNSVQDVLPSQEEFNALLEELPPNAIHPSLAVDDILVPEDDIGADAKSYTYDTGGYTTYGRAVQFLLRVCASNRQLARRNLWVLHHFLATTIYAEDALQAPLARNPLFSQAKSQNELNDLLERTRQIVTYLLPAPMTDQWHTTTAQVVLENRPNLAPDEPAKFVTGLIARVQSKDSIRESRILYLTLKHVLASADKNDADHWFLVARRLEKPAPQSALAVILAITRFAPEPPRLDRYRNELAAGLLGISAVKADTEGYWSLRRLAATAPDPDSDIVFLSQQRAVNLLKACQQWIASEEDIDEKVESMMTLLFQPVVPILQNVPGGHWDFIFDIMENNLENCSFADESTLIPLARTLRLVIAMQDLVLTNKSLRELWHEREPSILKFIRDLVADHSTVRADSKPKSMCLELVLTIVQSLSTDLMDENTLSTMCHLLSVPSVDAQKMAYELLRNAAKKRTEHLVIEAAVDTGEKIKCELPVELIGVLQSGVDQGNEDEEPSRSLFGRFLGWMIVFDLFADASLRVRSGYVEQLQETGIVNNLFVPDIFETLGLYGGPRKVFRLDNWDVGEFYISLYDSDVPHSLQLLAAHLYYRALLAVPSIIRSWLQDCRDRQTEATVLTYTSQYFSPALIQAELLQVKSPEAQAELSHESLTIKVASSVNEVSASYAVDEHQLEITLRMPTDWPLHAVEVRDSKGAGVQEQRWRAWVLGVKQIMWSQSGTVVDGLNLFKRNVSLFFEGQVECAICYSIISPLDDSLPRKPCSTCKNRFHAACLYKWFKSSHSSTCPLCRSDISF